MASGTLSNNERDSTKTSDLSYTRRGTLALLGTGMMAGVMGTARASSHESRVYNGSSGTFIAENGGEVVYRGGDLIAAIQAGVDSLTPGRTSTETVRVDASGRTGSHSWDGDVKAVDLPSYTVLDVPGTITVNDSGSDLIVPVRAEDVHDIAIPRLNMEGNPRYGVWIKSCSNVSFGNVWMSLPTTSDIGIGLRIDASGDNGRTTNVQIDNAYIEESLSHAIETYGVDGIDIGQVHSENTGGCGLLLNDTATATVDNVVAINPDPGGGYAGFRVANHAGPNISVGHVTCRGGGRGVFGVSGSHDFTIDSVHLVECDSHGILIQDCQNATINRGLVRNCNNEAVRIDSRSSDRYLSAENITIQNLRIADVRDNKRQTYGILETGPGTNNNAVRNNDVRDGGTEALIEIYADSTEVRGNVTQGSTDFISSGTYYIEAVHSGKVADVSGKSTENGANIVQWSYTGGANQHWNIEHLGGGVYRAAAVHSGKLMEVNDASIDFGANVQQWPSNGHPTQMWHIVDRGSGEYSIENVNSGQALDVYNRSTENGANIMQYPWTSADNQRWAFTDV
jgi:hypothetical protein